MHSADPIVHPSIDMTASWGSQLVRWREERGMSQEQLADALVAAGVQAGVQVFCEARHVRRWERGETLPMRTYRGLLAAVQAPVPEVPRRSTRPMEVVDPMRRRAFLVAVASAVAGAHEALRPWHWETAGLNTGPLPLRVGGAEVKRLRELTARLRGLASQFGGEMVVDPAAAPQRGAAMLDRCDEEIRADLHIALADLANEAGWAFHDSGQQARALERLTQGLDWALSSDTREGASLASNLLYGMARVALHQNDPGSALKLVQFGQVPAAEAGDDGGIAQLHATAAWAYAMMGRPREMTESLRRAEHNMSTATATEPWMRIFFSSGDFIGHQALVHGVLATHTTDRMVAQSAAATSFELTAMSLAGSESDRPVRSLLFDKIVAAQAAFRVGDVDAGVRMSDQALGETAVVASRRAVERLPEIAVAARLHMGSSTVADLMQELDQAADRHTAPS